MVRRVSICLGSLAIAVTAMAQASFMTGDSIAVFYPSGYDASQHQPSPIFENEPTALLPLSTGWTLRPVFEQKNGKSVAKVHVGNEVDLYGTGIPLWDFQCPTFLFNDFVRW